MFKSRKVISSYKIDIFFLTTGRHENLIVKFNAHINVELFNDFKSVKCLVNMSIKNIIEKLTI